MSKCVYCHSRKGKRNCPALGGFICTQCCGSHRQREIRCPADCVFLEGDARYSHERQFESFLKERANFRNSIRQNRFETEKLETHMFVLEYMLYHYYFETDFKRMSDGEVVDALRFVRGKLSRVTLLDRVETPLGSFLWSRLAKELQGSRMNEDVFGEAVDLLVPFIGKLSGTLISSDRYIRNMIREIDLRVPELRDDLAAEKVKTEAQPEHRIILP